MSTPLRDLITTLLFDGVEQAAFAADPVGFLGDHGWSELDGQDVGAALSALVDELPVEQAAQLSAVVAEADSFDEGLSGAITGLGMATEAFSGPALPGAESFLDPATAIDAGDHPDIVDPAAGIDEHPDVEVDDGEAIDGGVDDGWDLGDDEPEVLAALDEPADAGPTLGDPLDGLDDPGEQWMYEPELDVPADVAPPELDDEL